MSTSNTCTKRLKKEILKLVDSPDDFITLSHDKDDIRAWSAVIRAPPDSVYEGFLFDVGIEVGPDYPLAPPTMKFLTKIFHPNVHYETGEICLNILKKEWSPAWSLQSASHAIMTLLAEPAADRTIQMLTNCLCHYQNSPLNCDAGNMLRAGDDRAFKSLARMYCVEFARKHIPVIDAVRS